MKIETTIQFNNYKYYIIINKQLSYNLILNNINVYKTKTKIYKVNKLQKNSFISLTIQQLIYLLSYFLITKK